MKTATSGRKYRKIPVGYSVDEWDKMSIPERMKAAGMLKMNNNRNN